MDIYALESLQEKIFFPKTKEYFKEVISSYNNQNYRSATVMIWSVVVYDLVLKMQNLVDAYNDSVAKNILKEIKKEQVENPKSSKWEVYLVEQVCKQTDLIDDFELTNLEYLQQQRHLSAHPVIKDSVELYVPNRDAVRSLIRHALEIVLVKPPIYTKKVINNILTDLSENSEILDTIEDVEGFTKQKYLNRLPESSIKSIFRSFWKFVFSLDNEDCNKNRFVNLKFLSVLSDNYTSDINNSIKEDSEFFSNIRNVDDDVYIHYLLALLFRNPEAYRYLSNDIQMRIKKKSERSLPCSFLIYFLYDDYFEYYKGLEELLREKYTSDVPLNYWNRLKGITDSKELENEFVKLIALYYSLSMNFDTADKRFNLIDHFFDLFNESSLIYLLKLSEDNSQTYNRGKAPKEYYSLKGLIKKKYQDFDFSPFTEFEKQVEWYKEHYIQESNTDEVDIDNRQLV